MSISPGVEAKTDLVGFCNDLARASEFDALEFVGGTIDSYDVGDVDILIALHACNTATDDAIYKGIMAQADLIVVAPCCHQQIRPQIKPPAMLKNILKHGVMLERVAETLTDGLRSSCSSEAATRPRCSNLFPSNTRRKTICSSVPRLAKPRGHIGCRPRDR